MAAVGAARGVTVPSLCISGNRQGRGHGWHHAHFVLPEYLHNPGVWVQHGSSAAYGIPFSSPLYLLRLFLQLTELLFRVRYILVLPLRKDCGDNSLDSRLPFLVENPHAEARCGSFPLCVLLPLSDYFGAMRHQLPRVTAAVV